MSKLDQMVEMIKEAKSTRDDILATLECTTGSMASYLTSLRTGAKYSNEPLCPVEVEDGDKKVFKFFTHAEAEEMRAAKGTKARVSSKSPEERLEAATKRVAKCQTAVEKSAERLEANKKDQLLKLRDKKVNIELQIAEYELSQCDVPADDMI